MNLSIHLLLIYIFINFFCNCLNKKKKLKIKQNEKFCATFDHNNYYNNNMIVLFFIFFFIFFFSQMKTGQ